jgi:uncharacterized membrane protein YccC
MKLSKLLLLALPLLLASFVLADADPPPDDDDGDDVVAFQRDLPLIEALVNEGLEIAAHDDPLKRASACNRLADHFSREMHNAVMKKSNNRAHCMGHHLEDLLLRGVAHNLSLAKKSMPKDSPRRAELDRLGEQAAQAAKRFEADMSRLGGSKSMNHTLEAIKKARFEVQQAIKGKSNFFDKFRKSKKKTSSKTRA